MYGKSIYSIVFLLLTFLCFNACKSTDKLVDLGDYDQAISMAIKKLAGKKNKNEEVVRDLESAFAKVNERDLRKAAQLKAENRPETWPKIYNLYKTIRRRQERIAPLLPLVDKRGYEASFDFVETSGYEREAKENTADFYYNQGLDYLARGEAGDKEAARTAYGKFKTVGKYYSDYKDRIDLMNKAEFLGIDNVLIKIRNKAPIIIPEAFNRDLLDISTDGMDTRWRKYHPYPQREVNYDYELVVSLLDVQVSPESIAERQYDDTKEIEDGFDYVLDDNGNVMKDTSGNDIKVPRKVIIKATVIEVFQSKAARVVGSIDFVDLRQNAIVESERFDTESIFENYASTFTGDERALSDDSKKYCRNQVLPFPTNEELLVDAAVQIRPLIRKKW